LVWAVTVLAWGKCLIALQRLFSKRCQLSFLLFSTCRKRPAKPEWHAAADRVKALRQTAMLPRAPEILELAQCWLQGEGLPAKAGLHALLIACAVCGCKLPLLVTSFELVEPIQSHHSPFGTTRNLLKSLPRANAWRPNHTVLVANSLDAQAGCSALGLMTDTL